MKQTGVAFLWDESFLWGIIAYKALRHLDLPFDLISAKDIRSGVLDNYRMIFVPGGWASNKSKALGEDGTEAIRRFVDEGGNYLGFCGGAGLATKSRGGIGLLDVARRPTKERVPSFNGRISLKTGKHQIWKIHNADRNNSDLLIFSAWWPSQFVVEGDGINVLARYGAALPDSFSSDLNVGDVEQHGDWTELEHLYGINLDPARIQNEPAIIEGTYGKGRVVLSLIHFDTPEDTNGQQMMVNLWEYLAGPNQGLNVQGTDCSLHASISRYAHTRSTGNTTASGAISSGLLARCAELISLGERNFLWFWRNPMILQWRRGVRGLEYNSLYIMLKELQAISSAEPGSLRSDESLASIENRLTVFIDKSKRLLLMERHALQKGNITYARCDDQEIRALRAELFSDSKSHGGQFKELLDHLDNALFLLLKNHRHQDAE